MKNLILIFCCLFLGIAFCKGQPKTQIKSLRAPVDIKIDGNLNEWNNQLQIRNSIDGISYTISNNNENLYLTLIAPYREASKKAVRGGITFSISKLTNRRRNDDPALRSVTFPLSKNLQNAELFDYFSESDKLKTNYKRDSLARIVSKNAKALFKTMKVGDDIVSVYNEMNIVAGISFNQKLDMIYELAIPLKFLELDINYDKPFSYTITLNGKNADSEIKYIPTAAHPTPPPAPVAPPGTVPLPPDWRFMPTDVSGEYTLAK